MEETKQNEGQSLEERLSALIEKKVGELAPETEEKKHEIKPQGEIKVKRDELETRQSMAVNTLGMLRAMATGNGRAVESHVEKLVRGGHYGDDLAREARAAGDYYSTLVNADGAYLLPTVVRQEIEEIAGVYGVARNVANIFNHVQGSIRIPGASGAEGAASAVAEGGEISSSMRAFQAIELNPQKWATIIPWTYEVQQEAGARVLADVQRAIGRSFAAAEDDAMINGDGTATYNSITGLFNKGSIGQLVLDSGGVAPEDVKPDDLILAANKISAGARNGLAYIFHPDMEAVFLTKKDTNGSYLFDYVSEGDVPRLKGKPVYYTEKLPGLGDSASTDFGLLVNGDYWHMATSGGFTSEEMRTGSVKDADTGTSINLGTQDLRALKVRELFDMDANFDGAFMKFTTAAS